MWWFWRQRCGRIDPVPAEVACETSARPIRVLHLTREREEGHCSLGFYDVHQAGLSCRRIRLYHALTFGYHLIPAAKYLLHTRIRSRVMAFRSPNEAVDKPLSYSEINDGAAKPSILLIHGAFGSGAEWDLVTPHLSDDYHLLLPDLPGHGGSKDIGPFSKELSGKLLADLIQTRALDGKANVVGFSLGAHIAIELASKYPERVHGVFVSGYEVYKVSPQTMVMGLRVDGILSSFMPRSITKWFMDGTDLATPPFTPSPALRLAVAEVLCLKDDEWPPPWKARALIVAAGKSGLLPTADHPHDATRLRDIGRATNQETKAVTHPKMRHPWNRQAPELCSRAITMWFENGDVVEGFVEL